MGHGARFYIQILRVVHNQTLPGTPALKFNAKNIYILTHEIELESKAAQIHSAVFFFDLKKTELDS